MKTLSTALAMSSLSLAVLVGCSDNAVDTELDRPPVACFVMSAEQLVAHCPFFLDFDVDPSCTRDDKTKKEDLRIRWDLNNDGDWDTQFIHLCVINWQPDPAEGSTWSVKCEVEDGSGNRTVRVDSLDWGPIPDVPDLVADTLLVQLDETGVETDTVKTGEQFCVLVYVSCWGDFSARNYKTEFYKNTELLGESNGKCLREWDECGGYGICRLVIDNPGEYEITAVLDTDNDYSETNEANNSTSIQLTVVQQ